MIGAVIGAAAGLAGSVIGGIQANKKAKEAMRQVDMSHTEATSALRKQINQDYTQTAAAQAALARARELYQQGLNNANGTNAVMGGTDASVAAAKQTAANGLADVTSNIAQQGQQLQTSAENALIAENQQYRQQMANIYSQQAAANAQAGSQAMQAGMGLAMADAQSHIDTGKGVFGETFGKGSSAKKTPTPFATQKANTDAWEKYANGNNMFGFKI